jgi:hypothetical protein
MQHSGGIDSFQQRLSREGFVRSRPGACKLLMRLLFRPGGTVAPVPVFGTRENSTDSSEAIGGGQAGLAAAHFLTKHHRECMVIESHARLGLGSFS